jgi:hypothetical protein
MTLCHRCDGDRWIPADDDPDQLKPCPVCRPDQHARWASGAYEPGFRTDPGNSEPHEPDPGIRAWFGDVRDWLANR